MNKAHVEHSVGFVEHKDFNTIQAERIALDQIEKPPGRRDQNVDAILQRADLSAQWHAADCERTADAQMTAISPETFQDLTGQLARRA